MTKTERELVEDILYYCEQYCGGYLLIDELNEEDVSPKDSGTQSISIIRKRAITLLTGEAKEVDQIPEWVEPKPIVPMALLREIGAGRYADFDYRDTAARHGCMVKEV